MRATSPTTPTRSCPCPSPRRQRRCWYGTLCSVPDSGTLVCMPVDRLTRAFIRGAALAVTLSSCGESSTEPKLDPFPADYPTSVGPDYGDGPGYYGTCTGSPKCTVSVAGTCPAADSVYELKPPGSGTCSCATDLGPYAPPDPSYEEQGDCCYVIYSIACDGRPLRRDGEVLVAGIVARTDWMGSAELPPWS